MKKIFYCFAIIVLSSLSVWAQKENTKIFTVFTTGGCGCTGSGGKPQTFTSHPEVLERLQRECPGIDFIARNVTEEIGLRTLLDATYQEVMSDINKFDGVLIIGNIDRDYRLAFTGLPTIMVYNLFEFMSGIPYNLFATGQADGKSILPGGTNYDKPKVLTAQLDRRNLSDPGVTEAMFKDLVYKVKLIQTIKELKETRIMMVKGKDDIISVVNYRGDKFQSFPPDHNERSLQTLHEIFGVEIVNVDNQEFFETCQKIDRKKAERTADEWIRGAEQVVAGRNEIIKSATGYLAMDALREKYNCQAISTHIRSVTGSGKLEDRYNPGLGFEVGFKTRGIQAICQNYPDLLVGQIIGYLISGKPSMLGDIIFDVDNSTQIVLHCGIPINPLGGEHRLPYVITPHAESPVRDKPEEPGSSTGMRVYWPDDLPVTFWEINSINREIRLHTGTTVDGHKIYTGGENIDDVMCTAKVFAKVNDARKLRDGLVMDRFGIHTNAILGDLRQPIKDMAVLLGLDVVETDK